MGYKTMGKRKTFRKTMGGGPEEEALRNFFEKGRDRYTKLNKTEITYCSSEKKKNSCPMGSCKKAGRSQQIVSICSDYVHKLQPLVSGTVRSKGHGVLAIDSFNMNFLQQHITKKLEGKDYYKNVEHYEEVEHLKATDVSKYFGNVTTGIAFKYLKSSNTFENFLLNDKNYTVDQIVGILKTIFETNNKLYEEYQFQHCDMKCAQILLSISGDGDSKVITPILSDFDKSTCTIKIHGKPVRIRLTKGDAHNQRSTMMSMAKGFYFKHEQQRFEDYISLGLDEELDKMSAQLQELERFEDMPLASNKFYNVCLLASTLLLIKEDIFQKLVTKISKQPNLTKLIEYPELSECMKFININKVEHYRKKENNRKETAKK